MRFFITIAKGWPLAVKLAAADFKRRYAETALGLFWAVFQPALTVGIYVLVFSVGFRSAPVKEVPYVLWLIAGMVPWLFFCEGFSSVSSAVAEYGYLVQKTRFRSPLLPAVKLLSALPAHALFVVIALVIFAVNGALGLYALQLVYYSLCTALLAFGLGTIFCALLPYLKDVAQLVGVLIQMGFWATPIAWEIGMMSGTIEKLFRLNPVFYCVQGFRDSLIGGVWVWQRPLWTLYFWLFTALVLWLGAKVFTRLQYRFADVL